MRLKCLPSSVRGRRGATLVEFALMSTVFFMFLFGMLEYCRFLLVQHIGGLATRDAARFAAVNASRDEVLLDANGAPSATGTPVATTGTTHPTQVLPYEPALASNRRKYRVDFIERYLISRMGGTQGNIRDMVVRVYPTDSAALYQNPAVVLPKENSTSWNDADFPARVAVEISGQYQPILPNFLFLGGITRINIISLTIMEG